MSRDDYINRADKVGELDGHESFSIIDKLIKTSFLYYLRKNNIKFDDCGNIFSNEILNFTPYEKNEYIQYFIDQLELNKNLNHDDNPDIIEFREDIPHFLHKLEQDGELNLQEIIAIFDECGIQ